MSKEEERDLPSSPLSPDEEFGEFGDELDSEEDLVSFAEKRMAEARLKGEHAGLEEEQLKKRELRAGKEQRSEYGHLKRVEKSIKLSDYRAHRSERDLNEVKSRCDCITLRMNRLPYDPTTIKEVDGTRLYKSIFGSRRDFGKKMRFLLPPKPKEYNLGAFSYIEEMNKKNPNVSDTAWINALKEGKVKHPEWLHTIADCMGGPVTSWNGAAGGYGANTQMLAIEGAIKETPGIGVEVKAFTRAGTRIAECYEYTVYSYNEKGQKLGKPQPITIQIDARRQWYSQEDWLRDRKVINQFLDQSLLYRAKQSTLFELPEIVSIDLVNGKKDQLLNAGSYLEEGPVFARLVEMKGRGKKSTVGVELVNTDGRNVISEGRMGHNRYEGYRKRLNITYPFHRRELMNAIKKGDLEAVQEVMEKFKIKSDITDVNKNSLAHYAAKYGNNELLTDLMEKDLKLVTLVNNKGEMPLHLAAKNGFLDTVKLLSNKENINTPNNEGNTPLHLAMQTGNPELVLLLLKNGADPKIPNKNGETPLHLAAKYGFDEAIQPLIDGGANINAVDKQGNTSSHIAAKFNRAAFLTSLYKSKANLGMFNTNGDTILHIAAQSNSVDVINLLVNKIKMPPNILNNKTGNTPLHTAAIFGQADAISILVHLKAGINLKNPDGNTPLHLAAINNQGNALLVLCKEGADESIYNNRRYNAVHEAAVRTNLDALQAMSKAAMDLNVLTNGRDIKNSALHIAIERGDDKVIKILYECGANLDTQNIDYTDDEPIYRTPDEYARSLGKEEWFDLLMEKKDEPYFVPLKEIEGLYQDEEEQYVDSYNEQFELERFSEEEYEGFGSELSSEELDLTGTSTPSDKKPMTGVSTNYLYRDDDINDYCSGMIANKLGGYAKDVEDNAYHFLLGNYSPNGNIIAVTGAIDSAGISTPIDYFFDERQQPGQAISNDLKLFLSDELLKKLSVLLQEKGEAELRNEIWEILYKATKEIKQDKDTISRLVDELIDTDFEKDKVEKRIEKLNEFTKRKNVLDEVLPVLNSVAEKSEDGIAQAKILFPYNVTNTHWITAEVVIRKEADKYLVDIYSHDPYGSESGYNPMPEKHFKALEAAIRRKLPGVEVEVNQALSTYKPRQSKGDGTSCGVIVADDIIKLAQDQNINRDEPYPVGAKELREEQDIILSPLTIHVDNSPPKSTPPSNESKKMEMLLRLLLASDKEDAYQKDRNEKLNKKPKRKNWSSFEGSGEEEEEHFTARKGKLDEKFKGSRILRGSGSQDYSDEEEDEQIKKDDKKNDKISLKSSRDQYESGKSRGSFKIDTDEMDYYANVEKETSKKARPTIDTNDPVSVANCLSLARTTNDLSEILNFISIQEDEFIQAIGILGEDCKSALCSCDATAELIELLKKLPGEALFPDSVEKITVKEIIARIESYQNGGCILDAIPSSFGLRETVDRLYQAEHQKGFHMH